MKTVKISELKAHLSANLRLVSSGEEVLVCDRDRPIARIVPVVSHNSEYSERTKRLIAKGILSAPALTKGEAPLIPNPVTPIQPISRELMEKIWEEERADRA
jgi:antitoxin (DNA-binding transcriptional repressor) of toxin-antitoxin stability system